MTLICELDLDILWMYRYTENEVPRSRLSKGRALTEVRGALQTGRLTDRYDCKHYHAAFTGVMGQLPKLCLKISILMHCGCILLVRG